MKRFSTLAVLVCATLAFAAESHPISLTRPTHFLEDMIVPGYDSANGPIRGVSVCYRYKHVRSMKAESSDAEATLVSVDFQPGWLELRSGSDVIANVPFPAESQSFNVSAFDGTLDFDGTSGFSFKSQRHGHGIVHITDPAIVARFMDVPLATITAQGFDLFTASGAGNLDAISTSKVIVQGEVIYNN